MSKLVELQHEDYEFKIKEKPSGHYARGEIIKWKDDNLCLVELFCNGKRYIINKSIIKYL
jgi:hypothetical protein